MNENNEFTGIINVGDGENSYDLTFGYSKNNSEKYCSTTDKYAPPAPPHSFFDAALNFKGERFYSKISSPESTNFYIMLQYGDNNEIFFKWENTEWIKKLEYCILQDVAKGELGVDVNMLEQNEINIKNTDVMKLKLIFKKND